MASKNHIKAAFRCLWVCAACTGLWHGSMSGQDRMLEFTSDGTRFQIPWSIAPASGVSLKGQEITIRGGACAACTLTIQFQAPLTDSNDPFNQSQGVSAFSLRVQNHSRLLEKAAGGEAVPLLPGPPASISFKVVGLDRLTEPEFGPIDLEVREGPAGQRPVQNFRLRVLFSPDPLLAAIGDCLARTPREDQYKCLEGLEAGASGYPGKLLETHRDRLFRMRDSVIAQLRSFKAKPAGNHRYEMVCDDCPIHAFRIEPDSGQGVRILEERFVEVLDDQPHFVTIYSKEWPTILTPEYKDLVQPGSGISKPRPGPPVAALSQPSPHEEPDTNAVMAPAEMPPVRDTISTPLENWYREISPQLTARNFFYLGKVNVDSLLQGYLAHGTPSEKMWVARIWLTRAYSMPLLGILILVIALGRRFSSRNKYGEIRAPEAPAEEPITPVEKPSKLDIRTVPSYHLEEEVDLGITIEEVTRNRNAILDASQLAVWQDQALFVPIPLKNCWEDSAVSVLFLHARSIRAIDHMVKTKNCAMIGSVPMEQIPEIGGFLLGKVARDTHDQYAVSVEKFVPITPERNNRYTVKFGDQAWSELDDAQRAHKDLKLVGWFHTHPGHGLFLSEADLSEHRQLFRQRYQIAIEIDPCTSGLDTAFFTWTRRGDLNNYRDRKKEQWWSFEALNQQV